MRLYGTAKIDAEGQLNIGGVEAAALTSQFGTPLYVMDEELIRQNCRAYTSALRECYPNAEVAYASKAFLCTAMVALIQEEGLSLDVVSGGEIATALKAGYPLEKTYFHGNNKSPAELELALTCGVGRIVVDSLHELDLLNQLAWKVGKTPKIYLRITPGVDAHTHHYITTGNLDSKFGIPIEGGMAMQAIKRALGLAHVELAGLHCHIGSQIFDLEAYQVAVRSMLQLVQQVRKETGFVTPELNMGGGLGIRYTNDDTPTTPERLVRVLTDTVKAVATELGLPLPRLILEPGRSIVGEAGTTLYTVGIIKEIPGVRTYLAVDGGMGDNIRPALYQARYDALVANKADEVATRRVTVVGRYCESGDRLIEEADVAASVAPGDLLAIFATGAYNYTMASHYNRFPKPAVVFVRDGEADLVVRRESFAEMAALDLMPERLQPKVAATTEADNQ